MFYFFLFTSYLLGSIPFGLILCKKIKDLDLRKLGSKNIGATNAFRVAGKKLGAVVLLLDVLKGTFAVLLPRFFDLDLSRERLLLIGITAIIGHTFPIWLKFKGGKGAATSLGVFIAITPMATLITFAFFIAIFLIFRILSLASLSAAIIFPIVIYVLERNSGGWFYLQAISFLLATFIFYTHRANIGRLLNREEKRLF